MPENQAPHRSSSNPDQPSRKDAHDKNGPTGQVDVIAMVRSLQRTEGRADCFRTGSADCDITDCDWRAYCLGTPTDRSKKSKPPTST